MEKCLIWYYLNLKKYIKKRSTWIPLAALLLLMVLLNSIRMPKADNLNVGIVTNDSVYAKAVIEQINQGNSCFCLQEYTDEQVVMEDVKKGTLECAFVLDPHFDDQLKKGTIRRSIMYYSSPFSTKGEVAKETLFAALLEYYSETVLKQSEKDLFSEEDSDRMQVILEQNERFKKSEDLFYMKEEYVALADQKSNAFANRTFMTQGLVGLAIFLLMFLNYFQTDVNEDGYIQILSQSQRRNYRLIRMYAAATPMIMIGGLFVLLSTSSRGLLQEIIRMLLLILYSGIWNLVIDHIPHKKDVIATWFLALAVISAVICPIFYDFSFFIPILNILKYCLPLGIYI